MSDESLPVVNLEGEPGSRREANASVWGVLLAAGTSSRFGAPNKLLEQYEGRPVVWHAATTLAAASLDGVVAVVGYQSEAVRAVVDDIATVVCPNEDFADGQSTSVRTGITAARDRGADAVVVALGDMPTVRPATVTRLIDAYESGYGSALAAAYDGSRGNPVLFDHQYFDTLTDVAGDVGGRDVLLTASDAALVETGDPGVVYDIDRPSDLDEPP